MNSKLTFKRREVLITIPCLGFPGNLGNWSVLEWQTHLAASCQLKLVAVTPLDKTCALLSLPPPHPQNLTKLISTLLNNCFLLLQVSVRVFKFCVWNSFTRSFELTILIQVFQFLKAESLFHPGRVDHLQHPHLPQGPFDFLLTRIWTGPSNR